MAAGLVAKILLGFLVLTFGLWGIGDIFRNHGSQTEVASVNGESISTAELDALIKMLQRSYPEVTSEMAGDPRFKTEALNNLINNRLMRAESKALGLEFSSSTLASYIARNPAFQTKEGTFNRDVFIETLKQNNFTERNYLSRFAEDLSSSFIDNTLSIGWLPSEAMLGLYHFIRNESRDATLILLSDSDIPAPKAATDTQLEAIYKREQPRFTKPETRTLRYISFDTETAWKQLKLDADEKTLKSLYNERKDSLNEPEKRTVDQLLFMTEKAAQAALGDLEKGKNWAEISKSNAIMNPDSIHLGEVTMTDLPAEAANDVFALKQDGHSGIIKTGFGWHIFYVQHITKPHQKTFEEAKAQLAKDYRAETAEQKVSELSNTIEDALAGGATLEDALKQAGLGDLKPVMLGPLSSDGKDASEHNVELKPLEAQALQTAFSLDQDETSNLNLSADNQYYLVQTTAIEPEAVKPMAAVKSQLEALYKQKAQLDALHKKAESVAKALKEAENPAEAAKDLGLTPHKSGTLLRTEDTLSSDSDLKGTVLTTGFVMELFRLKAHETSAPYPLPNGKYIIGILDAIHPAKEPTDAETSSLEKEFTGTLATEAMEHYFRYLRQKYDVEVHSDVLYGTSDDDRANGDNP